MSAPMLEIASVHPFLGLADRLLRAALLAPKDLSPALAPPPTAFQPISADTDLSSLTPQQIHELTQNVMDDLHSARPLISELAPISVLREEYDKDSFKAQIDSLKQKGFVGIMRARGDGDCFYRSLAYAYVENVLTSSDKPLAAVTALSTIHETQSLLASVGFEKLVYEDFYEVLAKMMEDIARPLSSRTELTPRILVQAFQDAEISNSIVMYLRMLTSAQIRLDPENYEPFLTHPDLGIPMNAHDFCVQFVEAVGKEADHVQVAALSRALNINVQVAYLDGRSADGHIDFVPFTNNEDHETIKDLHLLYRPGHYDVLETKESHDQLDRQRP